MSLFRFAAAAIIVLALSASDASATPVVVTFSGIIDYSATVGIDVGTPYSGILRYDTNDAHEGIPPRSNFYSFGPTDLLSYTVGLYTFSISGNSANGYQNYISVGSNELVDGTYIDVFFAGDTSTIGVSSDLPGLIASGIFFQLAAMPGLVTSEALPTDFDFSKVVAGAFGDASTGIAVTFADSSSDVFTGNFSSLQVETIPEPATGILLASALAGVFLRRRWLSRDGGPRSE